MYANRYASRKVIFNERDPARLSLLARCKAIQYDFQNPRAQIDMVFRSLKHSSELKRSSRVSCRFDHSPGGGGPCNTGGDGDPVTGPSDAARRPVTKLNSSI